MAFITRNTAQKDNSNNLAQKYVYCTRKWRNLRNSYLMKHPLCEICESRGIYKYTDEIHHVIPISTGKNKLEMQQLGFNWFNLKALCKDCHDSVHNKINNINDFR